MNEMQVFNNPEFGAIRTIEENGTVLFCGSDVAKSLGYSNPSKALSDHCRGVTKCYTPTKSGTQEMLFIPESDLYRLAFSSKLPAAEKFTEWVTNEVLPSIRKSGGYIAGQESMSGEELMAKALLVAQRTLAEREARLSELTEQTEKNAPKVLFADAVSASHSSILVGEMAKLLKQNGVDMGQNRLFTWMRENGYLINRRGSDYNMPNQRSMDLGLFTIKETAITHSNGSVSVSKTVKVTGKGQQYFVSKFLGKKEV